MVVNLALMTLMVRTCTTLLKQQLAIGTHPLCSLHPQLQALILIFPSFLSSLLLSSFGRLENDGVFIFCHCRGLVKSLSILSANARFSRNERTCSAVPGYITYSRFTYVSGQLILPCNERPNRKMK